MAIAVPVLPMVEVCGLFGLSMKDKGHKPQVSINILNLKP